MNKIILIGRISKDLELKTTASGKEYCNFSLAVNRDRQVDGQPDADFFNCTVWGKQAENLVNYQKKGNKIMVEGKLQNSTYEDQQGQKRYSTSIMVEHIEYLEKKNFDTNPSETGLPQDLPPYYQTKSQQQASAYANANAYVGTPQTQSTSIFEEDVLDIASDDLPF